KYFILFPIIIITWIAYDCLIIVKNSLLTKERILYSLLFSFTPSVLGWFLAAKAGYLSSGE
ncbi:MAG: hypothetical protein WCL30_03415, partial [Pseudomonadota bacterium]